MNVDDSKILETIERLAREAGVKEQRQPDPVKPERASEALRLSVRYVIDCASCATGMADDATFFSFGDGKTLTYGAIRSLKPWLEKQAQ